MFTFVLKRVILYIRSRKDTMNVKNPEFKSADTRDYSKPVAFMTIEELFQRHNKIQTLKDADTIIWITRKKD